MKEFPEKNPWLGLRTYAEGQYLYGRASEIESLSRDITYNRQTVVYGKSGIGKSSLLNAGVFPRLRKLNMFPINVRLVHKTVEQSYIQQIASAVENSLLHLRREVVDEDGKILIKENLKGHSEEVCALMGNESQESLWEYFHRHKFYDDQDKEIIPVLVIDQFEEIFTLCKDEKQKNFFFGELADLINDVPPEYIYSDTVSSSTTDVFDSLVIDGNEEFVLTEDEDSKENNSYKYLDDPQFHIVICLREDFLSYLERYTINIPLLKHNRFGLRPLDDDHAAEIILEPVPGLISKDVAVDIICKVSNTKPSDFVIGDSISQIEVDSAILSLFLSELFEQRASVNSTISKELVEEIGDNIIKNFYERTISHISKSSALYLENELISEDGETARRDSIFENQAKLNGVTNEELDYLKEERLIHEYPWNNDIRIEFIHDVLCPVIKERKEKREILRQQKAETRKLQEEAERKQREIEEKAAREKIELEAEAMRVRNRNKKWFIALSSISGFIAFSVIVYLYCFIWPYSESYGNFTTRNGWPIGLGNQLTSSIEKEKCTVYYKLTRSGRLSVFGGVSRPFTKVEILNWNGEPTTNVFIESPVVRLIDRELEDVKAAEFAKLLSQVSYWQYTPDANGLISMKTAFGINNQELYSENYSSTNNVDLSSKHVLWSIFNDKKGNPLQVSDNGTDRVRYTISDGYITGCSFFTVLGTPQINTSGVYGYSYELDSLSANVISQCQVDKFGDKIDSTIVHFTAFENGRYTKSDVCTVEYSKQNVFWRYKGHNDTIHISQKGFVDCISKTYDDSKRVSAKYKTQDELLEKKLLYNDTLVYSANYFYTSRLDSVLYFNTATQPNSYTERYSYPRKNVTERTFWSNGQKILINISMEDVVCHKIIKELSVQKSDSIITMSYYDCDNTLTQDGLYSKSEIIFDRKSGNVLFEYYYDSADEICKSEMFTYNEYGIRESRAVAGIDRTPVRCPNWDWNGFSYYSMKFLKDFTDNVFVTIMGINELGDKSYILKEDSLFTISELPLMFTTTENVNPRIKSKTFSFSLSKNNYEPLANKKNIPFLHILNKKSTLYNAYGQRNNFWRDGLFDNDIPYKVGRWRLGNSNQLLSQELDLIEELGGDFQVLRYVNNEYVILSFSVSSGSLYAEIHSIFLTDKEYNNIKRYLK